MQARKRLFFVQFIFKKILLYFILKPFTSVQDFENLQFLPLLNLDCVDCLHAYNQPSGVVWYPFSALGPIYIILFWICRLLFPSWLDPCLLTDLSRNADYIESTRWRRFSSYLTLFSTYAMWNQFHLSYFFHICTSLQLCREFNIGGIHS